MEWYTYYGYKTNPFETDTIKTHDELLNSDKELAKLLYWVESGNIILIKGPNASGKTRLAKEVLDKYKGKNKVALVRNNKEVDVEDLLSAGQSKLKKWFGGKPKNMIVILDNYSKIPVDMQKRLQYNFDHNYIKSIVITTISDITFIPSIKDRIGNRTLNLKPLTKKKQLEVVTKRLNNKRFFPVTLLEAIQRKSKTFDEFLKKAETAAKIAFKRKNKTVTKKAVDIAKVK